MQRVPVDLSKFRTLKGYKRALEKGQATIVECDPKAEQVVGGGELGATVSFIRNDEGIAVSSFQEHAITIPNAAIAGKTGEALYNTVKAFLRRQAEQAEM